MENNFFNKSYPKTASITITRSCNLRCSYCDIPNNKTKELNFSDWKRAIDIIHSLGIEKITFIGGEPTTYKDIVKCVDYALNDKNIECSLITNGKNSYETILRLIDVGLKKLSCSVDTLDVKKSISPIKLKSTFSFIKNLEKDNLLNSISLSIYCVLNKKNIEEVDNLIEYMSEKKINTYFIPYHYSDDNLFDHRKKKDLDLAFCTNTEIENLKYKIDCIIDMKRQGFLVSNSEEYLNNIKNHIKFLDWKCSSLSELRVDSDGMLMCCCDKKGMVNYNYSIFDIDDSLVLNNFIKDRSNDTLECNGCLWPSSFEAELLKNMKGRNV